MQILIMLHFLEMIWILLMYILIIVAFTIITFGNDDPNTIIHVRLMTWCNSYKQSKACKKEISIA